MDGVLLTFKSKTFPAYFTIHVIVVLIKEMSLILLLLNRLSNTFMNSSQYFIYFQTYSLLAL